MKPKNEALRIWLLKLAKAFYFVSYGLYVTVLGLFAILLTSTLLTVIFRLLHSIIRVLNLEMFTVLIALLSLAIWLRFISNGLKKIIEKIFTDKILIKSAFNYKIFSISMFLYSPKTQKEVFEPIIADWQEEYFEALSKKEIWQACWINLRYTYAFLAAMWQKSPVGDLIQFIIKIAKQ